LPTGDLCFLTHALSVSLVRNPERLSEASLRSTSDEVCVERSHVVMRGRLRAQNEAQLLRARSKSVSSCYTAQLKSGWTCILGAALASHRRKRATAQSWGGFCAKQNPDVRFGSFFDVSGQRADV
jgi:hypothetical protein